MRSDPPPQSSETMFLSRIGSSWELRTRNYRCVNLSHDFAPDAMEHLPGLKQKYVVFEKNLVSKLGARSPPPLEIPY